MWSAAASLRSSPSEPVEPPTGSWTAIPEAQRQGLAAIAVDMWEPYLEATRTAAPQAAIVHDKLHCAKELNKAVDLVRRREHRELKREGDETLVKTKYLWLKNPRNWTEHQRQHFRSLQIDTLKVGRAWAIKEAFTDFWEYRYAGSARKFFDRWYFWATHSRLVPIINAAKTLKRHRPGLLAYTQAPHHQCGGRSDQCDHPAHQSQRPGLPQLRAVPHRDLLSLRET